jgi:dolichyl-diphosphooligosaccharide--protein glycosyltransferase
MDAFLIKVYSEFYGGNTMDKHDDEITIDFSKFGSKIKSLFGGKKKQHKESEEQKIEIIPKETNETSQKKDEISIDYDSVTNFSKKYWHYLVLFAIILFVIYMRNLATTAPVTDDWARSTMYNYLSNQIRVEVEAKNPYLPEDSKTSLINKKLQEVLKTEHAGIEQQIKTLSQQYKQAISYTYEGKSFIYLGDIDSYYWLRFSRNIVDHGNICDEIREGKCYDTHIFAPLGGGVSPTMHMYLIAWVYKIANFLGFKIPIMHAAFITPTVVAVLVAIAAYFVGFLLAGRITGLITALLLSANSMYVQRSLGSDNDIYNLLFPLIVLSLLFIAINAESIKKKLIFGLLAGFSISIFKFAWEAGWWNILTLIIYSFIAYFGFLWLNDFYRTKDFFAVLKNKYFKEGLIVLVSFYIAGFVGFFFVSQYTGASMMEYVNAPLGPLTFSKFSKAAVNLNVWPNVLTTVAEFNPLALREIPGVLFSSANVGNSFNLLFMLGILGIMLLFADTIYSKKEKSSTNYAIWIIAVVVAVILSLYSVIEAMNPIYYFGLVFVCIMGFLVYAVLSKIELDASKNHHILSGIILTIWFIGTTFAATKGIRFTMLIVPSACIAIACCFEIIYKKAKELFDDYNQAVRIVANIILIVLLLWVPLTSAANSMNVSRSFIPNYNAAWDEVLLKINSDSEKSAIINSWWDFGHWFKYTADRAVTLDGATQNSPQLHWLGKLLMTDNETVSMGILRMLDCSANNAFYVVYNTTQDTPVAVDIINKIIVMEDHDEIRALLSSYGVPSEDQERILTLSHCDPPENYLIASDDMIGKAAVWAHFGGWNFYKAEVASMELAGKSQKEVIDNLTTRQFRNMTKKEVEVTYNQMAKLYSDDQINAWISPWPSYYGEISCSKKANTSVYACDNGLEFDSKAEECYFNIPAGRKYPSKCVYVKGENVKIKYYNSSLFTLEQREVGLTLFPESESVMHVVMSDPVLAGSMFTRLFYMNGHGLKYFDKFDYKDSPLGSRIYVWKVDWKGESKNNVYQTSTATIQ